MFRVRWVIFILVLSMLFLLAFPEPVNARRRRRRRLPTHPVILWSRTLSKSNDLEQKRVAAFKLSQYSQRIYQSSIINTLLKCTKDFDLQVRVFCTKALGNAGNRRKREKIKATLLSRYHEDRELRTTIVRTFIRQKDSTLIVHRTFMAELPKMSDPNEILIHLEYFEKYGDGSFLFVKSLSALYQKHKDSRIRRALINALSEQGKGQNLLIELLSKCALSSDTPLALTCLSGIGRQAQNDKRAWAPLEKTILRSDPDVLIATLDVVNILPEKANLKIATRLIEIIREIEDPEIQEKSILALGSTGDQGEMVVTTLLKTLSNRDAYEATRIAAALSLGQQALLHPKKATIQLRNCQRSAKTQMLKTACQIGLKELEGRAKLANHSATGKSKKR